MVQFKTLLSFVLLMVYTIGLAQGTTSACNHYSAEKVNAESQNEHEHHHHVHEGSQLENHDHVEHQGHFDESAFDLLLCVLEDVSDDQNATDGCHCLPITSSRVAADWLTKIKLMAVAIPLIYIIENEEQTEYCVLASIGKLRQSQQASIALRGPPTIS